MTPDEHVDSLFSAARAAAASATADNAYWDLVAKLHQLGSASVFERAIVMCSSDSQLDRAFGADVLGQLGYANGYPFRDSALPVLERLLAESDSAVLTSALAALGHLRSPPLASIVSLGEHDDPDVRRAVAIALSCHSDPIAIDALIRLCRDPHPSVRDWAAFALGAQTDLDTPEIREALFALLRDSDPDARGEALSGLARRGDLRIIPTLRTLLDADIAGPLELEAASELGSTDLLSSLIALRSRSSADTALIDATIERLKAISDQSSG